MSQIILFFQTGMVRQCPLLKIPLHSTHCSIFSDNFTFSGATCSGEFILHTLPAHDVAHTTFEKNSTLSF